MDCPVIPFEDARKDGRSDSSFDSHNRSMVEALTRIPTTPPCMGRGIVDRVIVIECGGCAGVHPHDIGGARATIAYERDGARHRLCLTPIRAEVEAAMWGGGGMVSDCEKCKTIPPN